MAFYSIGASCLPKFGLDEYVGKTHTYFFDWLITDLKSLENSLLGFSENWFLRKGYAICDSDLRVKDLHTGLRFQHDFPTTVEGKINPQTVEQALDAVREKYIRRRSRLFDSIRNDTSPILIRYEFIVGKGSQDLEDKYEQHLRRIVHSSLEKDCRIIILSTDLSENRHIGSTLFCRVETEEGRPWRAKKKSWEYILSFFN